MLQKARIYIIFIPKKKKKKKKKKIRKKEKKNFQWNHKRDDLLHNTNYYLFFVN